MAAPVWQPGTLYLPGDLVQPITQPPPNNPQVVNGDFSAGNTGWTFSGDGVYSPSGGYGGGGPSMILAGDKPDGLGINNTMLVVPVGGQLVATSMINQGASSAGKTAGWTEIRWYDSLNQLLQTDKGNVVDSGSGGAWHQSKVTSTRPASAAYAKAAIHLTSVADHNKPIWGDNLAVSGASAGLPEGLVYKAVQAESGTSGSSEPAWPGILGQQVIDNEVIWEAVTTSRVTWTASPRYVSGATEPDWPTDIGAMVKDGTINWRAISRRVTDEKCPQSKVVAIVASKVFAADKDIVRFSATANPLDWSTADDAGYLPTGLQQANSNHIAVLAPYRANLAPMNASSFQNWQVDPDPASMAILDQMDGVGSVWPRAAVGVSNDLFYLSQLGVRTIGIANAAENLAAGDVGAPIDVLVQDALRLTVANEGRAIATYYPGAGQYWLAFPDAEPVGPVITGNAPDAIIGLAYTFAYTVIAGSTPVTGVILASGTLPPGLSLSSAGVLSGTPTQTGPFSFTLMVTDEAGLTGQTTDTITVETPVIETPSYVGNGLPNDSRKYGTLDLSNGGYAFFRQSESGGGGFHLYSRTAATNYLVGSSGGYVPTTDAFTTSGISTGAGNSYDLNRNGVTYWGVVARMFPGLLDVVPYVGTGSRQAVPHALGVSPGCIFTFAQEPTNSSALYHKDAGSGVSASPTDIFNGEFASNAWSNEVPVEEEFYVGANDSTNKAGIPFLAAVFAHSPDQFVFCGTWMGNGSIVGPAVEIGWAPRGLLLFPADRGLGNAAPCIVMLGSDGIDRAGGIVWQVNFNGDAFQPTDKGFRIVTNNVLFNKAGTRYRFVALR